MKHLSESIFDTEFEPTVANTMTFDEQKKFGIAEYAVDPTKHAFIIKKSSGYIDIQPTLIKKLKGIEVDTIIVSCYCSELRFFEVDSTYDNFNIETSTDLIMYLADNITGLTIKAHLARIIRSTTTTANLVLKKCKFNCDKLSISQHDSIKFDNSCKVNVTALNCICDGNKIMDLAIANESFDINHKLVHLFDYLPLSPQIAKNIDEIHISGSYDASGFVQVKFIISKTQKLAFSKAVGGFMQPVELDVRGPWKFGGKSMRRF